MRVGFVSQSREPCPQRPDRARCHREQGTVRSRAFAEGSRSAEGLPHEVTLTTEDFMSLTLDVWEIAPESARRVGHPAPFPLELPERLIALYTYADDLVLDPFMGSGTALVAAARMRSPLRRLRPRSDVCRHRSPAGDAGRPACRCPPGRRAGERGEEARRGGSRRSGLHDHGSQPARATHWRVGELHRRGSSGASVGVRCGRRVDDAPRRPHAHRCGVADARPHVGTPRSRGGSGRGVDAPASAAEGQRVTSRCGPPVPQRSSTRWTCGISRLALGSRPMPWADITTLPRSGSGRRRTSPRTSRDQRVVRGARSAFRARRDCAMSRGKSSPIVQSVTTRDLRAKPGIISRW